MYTLEDSFGVCASSNIHVDRLLKPSSCLYSYEYGSPRSAIRLVSDFEKQSGLRLQLAINADCTNTRSFLG